MKVLIIGGCFTCQHNIPYERLYHQTIRNRFIENGVTDIQIMTGTYNRLSNVLNKLVKIHEDYKFDVLIFHIRTEPVFRYIKAIYKYQDKQGKIRRVLNHPFVKLHELSDLNSNRINIADQDNRFFGVGLSDYLRKINYLTGCLLGNKARVLRAFGETVLLVHTFCRNTSAELILTGPVSGNRSKHEHSLSLDLNEFIRHITMRENVQYIELFGEYTADNKPMFFPNKLNISQEGHDEIGERLFNILYKPNLK